MYYEDKLETLRNLFGTNEIRLDVDILQVGDRSYPIIDDVIILLDTNQYPAALRDRIGNEAQAQTEAESIAKDIQFTFGEEWNTYSDILPEHEQEFANYFDLVNISELEGARVCDLGCGMGRWSHFLRKRARELVLVDFSEAIFVARRNLAESNNTLFFMCDLRRLPFREDFADFLFCLGVLHHLPVPALETVRELKPFARKFLIYLYYALDNRPLYYRLLLKLVTFFRIRLARLESARGRSFFTWMLTFGVYLPLIIVGKILKPFKLSEWVPLYEGYQGKSVRRIKQDVYDRFFTRIEQRVTQREILTLQDTFREVKISENQPYWHFLCEK